MNKQQSEKSMKIIAGLIENAGSQREFARIIKEHVSDVYKWKSGDKSLTTRATLSICRIYGLNPNDLNPDVWPDDLTLVFKKEKK